MFIALIFNMVELIEQRHCEFRLSGMKQSPVEIEIASSLKSAPRKDG
jgi:hypothetical protein